MSSSLQPFSGTYATGGFFPYIPPISPYVLPSAPFDDVISALGIRLGWGKSHTCACISYPTTNSPAGSPNQSCQTCSGRGIYWDALLPFTGLITYGHIEPAPDEPGLTQDPKIGMIIHGEPRLSIPYNAGVSWEECSEFDLVVELDAQMRFNTTLSNTGNQTIPYQQGLSIAAIGAVTTWATGASGTGSVVPITGYTVSGATVTIPPVWVPNTNFVVEFIASPTYVCFRIGGGLPHVRPFAGGGIPYPRRFRLQPVDLWLRNLPLGNY